MLLAAVPLLSLSNCATTESVSQRQALLALATINQALEVVQVWAPRRNAEPEFVSVEPVRVWPIQLKAAVHPWASKPVTLVCALPMVLVFKEPRTMVAAVNLLVAPSIAREESVKVVLAKYRTLQPKAVARTPVLMAGNARPECVPQALVLTRISTLPEAVPIRLLWIASEELAQLVPVSTLLPASPKAVAGTPGLPPKLVINEHVRALPVYLSL
jgi:hypothetical protein